MNDKINKKGTSEMWWIIVAAVVALVVVILIILWFQSAGGKAFGTVGTQLDNLGDSDNDTVSNMFDKCKTTPSGQNVNSDGCASGEIKPTS